MNVTKLNTGLALVANVGVLVGMLFLAAELRQANRIAIGTAETEFRNTLIDLGARVIDNPNVAETLYSLRMLDPELTPIQSEQMRMYARNQLTFLMSVQAAFDNGLISGESFDTYLGVASFMIATYPGLAPFLTDLIRVRTNVAENAMTRRILQSIENLY